MPSSKRNPDQCHLYRSQGPLRDRTRFMVQEDTAAYEQVRTSGGWDTTKRVAFRAGDVFWGHPRSEYIHGAMDCRYRFPGHVLTMQPPGRRNPSSTDKITLADYAESAGIDAALALAERANLYYACTALEQGLLSSKFLTGITLKEVMNEAAYNRPLRKNPRSTDRYLLLRRAGDYAVLDTLDRRWRSGATPANWKDTGFRADSPAQCLNEARRRQAGRQRGMDWARDRIGAKRRRNPDAPVIALPAPEKKDEPKTVLVAPAATTKANPSPRMAMLQQELARVKSLLRRASEADAVVLRSAKRLLERRIKVMFRQPVRM